jgi:hypothetical protein
MPKCEELANRNINAVRPGLPTIALSSENGKGLDEFLGYLDARRAEARITSVERM